MPSFGFEVIFLIDPKVAEKEYTYTSGGTENSLIKMRVEDILRLNKGKVVRVRK